MGNDPIGEEVRRAGEEIARRANDDLHALFDQLRKRESQRKAKVVSRMKEIAPK